MPISLNCENQINWNIWTVYTLSGTKQTLDTVHIIYVSYINCMKYLKYDYGWFMFLHVFGIACVTCWSKFTIELTSYMLRYHWKWPIQITITVTKYFDQATQNSCTNQSETVMVWSKIIGNDVNSTCTCVIEEMSLPS